MLYYRLCTMLFHRVTHLLVNTSGCSPKDATAFHGDIFSAFSQCLRTGVLWHAALCNSNRILFALFYLQRAVF